MDCTPQKLLRTLAAFIGVFGVPAALPAVAAAHRTDMGYVYVDDNTIGHNTIAAFARRADGSLTPLPGSPFNAGGAGTGSGLASQGAVQVSGDRRYVIAVDAGSNQISILRIGHDGALRLVAAVPSGGVTPVSVAEHDGLVYAANAGAADANYTGFTLTRGGQLEPLAGSTVTLPADAQPDDVLFNSTGTNLVGTRLGSSQIDSFRVGSDGRLAAAPGSPFPALGPGPFGSEFRPTDPSQLFVSNAHGGADNGTVSAFEVAADGTLSSIAGSPFADQQTAPCWVAISRDGRFLFAINTGSGTISRYSIAADGSLTLLGSTAVTSQSGVDAVDAGISDDGRTLYVDERGHVNATGIFDLDGGRLTNEGAAALPPGAAPAGVAVR